MNTFGSTFCGWQQIVAQFNGLTEKLKPNQALLWCSFKIIWTSPSELQLSAWKWLVMHLVHFQNVCDGALVYTLLYWRLFFINMLFPFHLPCDKYCNPSHCATVTTQCQSEFLVIFFFFLSCKMIAISIIVHTCSFTLCMPASYVICLDCHWCKGGGDARIILSCVLLQRGCWPCHFQLLHPRVTSSTVISVILLPRKDAPSCWQLWQACSFSLCPHLMMCPAFSLLNFSGV